MTTPNVVIILADDLGFSDIQPFGGEIDTPNLQRLADHGVRMSSFYVTPRCSPSRAALMTGRHPHSVDIGVLTTDQRPTGYAGTLSQNHETVAELLKARGYRTGMFGKWHLSAERETPSAAWPTRRGFERFRGILGGAANYYYPTLTDQEARVPYDDFPEDYHFTEDITEGGAAYIRENADQPFFLYMAYTAPHWPLQAEERDIAKYRDQFRAEWSELRNARLERITAEGLVPSVDDLYGHAEPEWLEGDEEWQIERMAIYAAQVESLDRGVGRLMEALEESGVLDNTLILFSSDNGGSAEELPAGRPIFSEDVCPRTTPEGEPISVGNDPSVMPGSGLTYQSYGQGWATLSNTPFRMWKRWVHEGGISTPFIAHWPAGGVATGAQVSHAPGHVVDILASIMDAVGGTHDSQGTSLLPLWRDPAHTGDDRPLFWEHMGNAAVRRGRWKLVREWGSEWELYDIEADRGEMDNLADEHEELREELTQLWADWAKTNGVIPWERILEDHDQRGLPRARAGA